MTHREKDIIIENQANEIEELKQRIERLKDLLSSSGIYVDLFEESVSRLRLSTRVSHALKRAGFLTIGDIYKVSSPVEFLSIPSLGEESVKEIIESMRIMGFSDWAKNLILYRNSVDTREFKHFT